VHDVTEVSISASKQNKMFDHSAILLSFVPLPPKSVARPTISNLILKDPDLDLVVALAVADTYLSCTDLNVGLDKDRLRIGVGSALKKLRELGVSETFLVSGELSPEASLLRAAKIAEIKEFLDTVPFDLLANGLLKRLSADPDLPPVPNPVPEADDSDLFLEGLMNNVRNSVVSHQNFVFKNAKKAIANLRSN
jgi:hypothetical protein